MRQHVLNLLLLAILAVAVFIILGLIVGDLASACDRPPVRYVAGWGGDIANALSGTVVPHGPGFGGDIVVALQPQLTPTADAPAPGVTDTPVPLVPLPPAALLFITALAAFGFIGRKA